MTVPVFKDAIEVANRLDEMGLTIEGLHEAIRYGETFRLGCTDNDPKISVGMIAWSKTNRGLRDWLLPQKWSKKDERNIPLVVSPAGDFAITVSSGDENTGNPKATPKSKNPKGVATENLVLNNQQTAFAFYEEKNEVAPASEKSRPTWVLLVARIGDEVRCELSLPNEIDGDGRVGAWLERIVLPPITSTPIPEFGATEFTDEIEIALERK